MRLRTARRLLLALLVLSPAVGLAQPPTSAERADALNRIAVAAYQKGAFEDAVMQWMAAEQIDPQWKYALNLAGTLPRLKRWVEAWAACQRARALKLPKAHLDQLDKLQESIGSTLRRDHARLEISVVPVDAQITLNKEPWTPGRSRWVTGTESHLRVVRSGYEPEARVVRHIPGRVHELTVHLVRQDLTGGLVLEGGPRDATVRLNGQSIGALPMARRTLKPGRYVVSVEKAGLVAFQRQVDVVTGETTTVRVSLHKAVSAPPPAPDTTSQIVGWTSLGVGIAAVGVGVAMLVWARSAADEADTLNSDPVAADDPGYSGYMTAHGALEDSYNARLTAGAVLTGVGVAAAITGAVFLALDDTPGPQKAAAAGPWILPGGGGLSATIRF